MNSTDELQRDSLSQQLMNPVQNRCIEVIKIQHILLHQHNSSLDLLLIIFASNGTNNWMNHLFFFFFFFNNNNNNNNNNSKAKESQEYERKRDAGEEYTKKSSGGACIYRHKHTRIKCLKSNIWNIWEASLFLFRNFPFPSLKNRINNIYMVVIFRNFSQERFFFF